MKYLLVFVILPVVVPSALAQNADLEFAEMLGREEYDDLAEHVLNHVFHPPVFTERTLGRYRFIRLAKIRAERESLIDRRLILIDEAIAKINDYPKVPQNAEVEWRAKMDLCDLGIAKAIALATIAETAPTKAECIEALRRSRDIYGKAAVLVDKIGSDNRVIMTRPLEEQQDLEKRLWTYLYEYMDVSHKVGEYEKVNNLLKQYDAFFPGEPFGGEPFRTKFEELRRRNDEAMKNERTK